MSTLFNSNRIEKPWGFYIDYFRDDSVVFKKIVVLPSGKLSYQYHDNRGEFWYVTQGTGVVTVDDDVVFIETGEHILIRKGVKHSVECRPSFSTGNIVPLIMYEMQFGECHEHDIVRLEDKYGRTEE